MSDDRMIVRKTGDELMAFGTPWPGDAGIAVNKGAPLAGILFLKHADETKVRRISPAEGANRLMPVVSIPWYDEVSVRGGLAFCDELVSRVPCYELAFRPEAEVVDALKPIFDGEGKV